MLIERFEELLSSYLNSKKLITNITIISFQYGTKRVIKEYIVSNLHELKLHNYIEIKKQVNSKNGLITSGKHFHSYNQEYINLISSFKNYPGFLNKAICILEKELLI